MITFKHSPGPVPNPRRVMYAKRYGLNTVKRVKFLTNTVMDQLDACKDESARRVLLGIRRKRTA